MEILRFKPANCKNCYKCLRECPVKAIGIRNGQAEILRNDCLICGHCLTVCPQNAKEARDDTDAVRSLIAGGKKVFASVAPSFIAAFETEGLEPFTAALQKLGFAGAEETAVGAAAVSQEYTRLLTARSRPVLISSACPTVVKLIEKYHPEVIGSLAPVISPMEAHARQMRARYGDDIAVVFIGPCICKKDEAAWPDTHVNAAITFEELARWFAKEGITFGPEPAPDPPAPLEPAGGARLYPLEGGIIRSMGSPIPGITYISLSGMDNCRKALREVAQGGMSGFFLELNACAGGCVNGPCMVMPRGGLLRARRRAGLYAAARRTYPLGPAPAVDMTRRPKADPVLQEMPGEQAIREILAQTGKFRPEQELNCGACGYPTCREKAVAVWQGKAEVSMCMPYMRERAEYISDHVIAYSPNAIVVLDDHLTIQAVNQAACELFEIKDAKEIRGKYVGDLTDASAFEESVVRRENILGRRMFLYRYEKYVEESVVYVRDHNLIFAIIRDLTQEEKQNQNLQKVRMDTAATADNVIEKQMRVVQEIAMLLGETAAETKIALTKLKETIASPDKP